jgi:hypothetical protein
MAADEYLKQQRGEQIESELNQVYAGETDATAEKRLLEELKTKFSRTIKDAW